MTEFLMLLKTYFVEVWHDLLTLNEWAFMLKHPILELSIFIICMLIVIPYELYLRKDHKKDKKV